MKDILLALKSCYKDNSCDSCPYNKNKTKCKSLQNNVTSIFNKIKEYLDFEDIHKIIKTIYERGEKK